MAKDYLDPLNYKRGWFISYHGSHVGTVYAKTKKGALRIATKQFGKGPYTAVPAGRDNPHKARRVRKSTGWIKAKAVRVEKRGRQYVVKVKR